MAIQSSGLITLQDIEDEFGGTGSISLSEYYRNGAYVTSNNTSVPTSGAISLSNFYGATNQFSFNIASNTQNANLNTLALSAGWDGSAPLIATVNSGVYLWSDDTSVAGLIINVACTVINYGKIMGRGGNGSYTGTGGAGGPAINVTSSGVTVSNQSGAYIAGGGGGGGGSSVDSHQGGGGGGAGGGDGGNANNGGSIGSSGSNGGSISYAKGYGGPAGGGGFGGFADGAGGGGGRILPGTSATTAPYSHWTSGTRYTTSTGNSAAGGAGGYAGLVGLSAGNNGGIYNGGGGGGGWGASGGRGKSGNGGAGGAAITGTSVSLTNNGTIYGIT
tara:strand:- start:414 stop:1409 length:996 start_codon:yes stop_codon:yes gene_type:complete